MTEKIIAIVAIIVIPTLLILFVAYAAGDFGWNR